MAPLPISLVGYLVSYETIERYGALNNLPEYSNRPLVQDLSSKISVPLTLVLVERDEGDGAESDYYFCCFADYSGKSYEPKDLLAIPVPPRILSASVSDCSGGRLETALRAQGDVLFLQAEAGLLG